MTLPHLRKRARYWCALLSIHDAVLIRWAGKDEIPTKWATVLPLPDHDTAEIIIHKSQLYLEFWLIHELIHVVLLNSHCRSTPVDAEEKAINQFARALCSLTGIEIPPKDYLLRSAA